MFDEKDLAWHDENFARELEHEDLAEQVFIHGKLTPREFATWLGTSPQMIYYYIRNGVLELEYCRCGRKVLDVETSTQALKTRQEARGQKLGTSPDRGSED